MLPLFPLNTVLCPGSSIALHIFEDRYKQMVAQCQGTDGCFGVVLIAAGQEALGPLAEPCSIGCLACIGRTQNLPEGRINLVAQGRERFLIRNLSHERPFLQGDVEYLPAPQGPQEQIENQAALLRQRLTEYHNLLERMGEKPTVLRSLPEDPINLAYRVISVVNAPLPIKQDLLATQDAVRLLAETEQLYRNQIVLLQALLECRAHPDRCHLN